MTLKQFCRWHEGTIAVVVLLLIIMSSCAFAREGGDWSRSDAMISEWFSGLTQPDNPYMSCCGEADAFESDIFDQSASGEFVAIITNGKGVIPNGTRITIPNEKIKWDKGNPTGHGWVFIGNQGQVYCYITPAGA